MIGNRLFLDTNIIIYLLNGDETLADILHQKQLFVSIITELELLSHVGLSKEGEERIMEFLQDCSTIGIDEKVKRETIHIRKKYGLKLPDSIIVASSIQLGLPLISADKQLQKAEELALVHYEK